MSVLSFAFLLVAAFALLGAVKGLIRGLPRQGLRFLSVIIAAVVAFIVTSDLADNIYIALKSFNEESVNALGESVGFEAQGTEFLHYLDLGVLSDVLSVPVGLLVVPFFFVVLFFLFRLVMLLVFWLACAILRVKRVEKTAGVRFGGLGIGAVQGILVALLVLVPVFGFTTTVADFTDSLEGAVDAETLDSVSSDIDGIADSPLCKVTMFCGGKALYKSLSKIPETDSDYVKRTDDPADRLSSVTDIVAAVLPLTDVDFSEMTQEDKDDVTAAVKAITEDNFLSRFTVGMLRYAALAIKSDNANGNLQTDDMTMPLLLTLADVFADTTETTLRADLDTLSEVLFLFSDEKVIKSLSEDFDSFSKVLGSTVEGSGKTVLAETIDLLNANPHTASIVNALAKMSVSMMAESTGVSEEVYDNLKSGMDDVLAIRSGDYPTREEYTEALSNELTSALEGNGINLDPETVGVMADYIADNYSDVTEISDSEFCDILLSYYAAYAQAE